MLRLVVVFAFASVARAARIQVDLEEGETAAELGGEAASEVEAETAAEVEAHFHAFAEATTTWTCNPSRQFRGTVQLRNAASRRLLYDNDGKIGAGASQTPEIRPRLESGPAEDGQQWCIEDAGRSGQYTITNLQSGNRLYHTSGLSSSGRQVRARTASGILPAAEEESWLIEPGQDTGHPNDSLRQLAHSYDVSFTISNVHSGGRLYAQSNRNARNGVGVMTDGEVLADQMWAPDDLVLDVCTWGLQRGSGDNRNAVELDASSALSHAQCIADVRRRCPNANGATIGSGKCFCTIGMQVGRGDGPLARRLSNPLTCSFYDGWPRVRQLR